MSQFKIDGHIGRFFSDFQRIRGRIISLQQCFINLGILVAFWIQYGTSHIHGEASWRIPIGLQLIPTLALHFTMYFMPESPRWLVQQDRQQDALQVLARLHSNGNRDNPYVRAELAEITTRIQWEKSNPPPSYTSMVFGSDARRTWLAIGVVSVQRDHQIERARIPNGIDVFKAILATSLWYQRVSPSRPLRDCRTSTNAV